MLRNQIKSRKIIKKRKKAEFPLPSAPVEVRSLPPSNLRTPIQPHPQPPRPRLQRKIQEDGNSVVVDFEPLFDFPERHSQPEDTGILTPVTTTTTTTTSAPRVSSLPRNPFGIQPRGEGFRLQYNPYSPVQPAAEPLLTPRVSSPYDPRPVHQPTQPPFQDVTPRVEPGIQPVGVTGRKEVPLTRRRFRTRPTPGGRFYVVKRRRRPNSVGTNRRNEDDDNEVEVVEGATSVNYQTDKAFHHEAVLENGERHGEYGYIDPIGVRRVVTYATGPRESAGGIVKGKENDYVGKDTYFEAN